MNLVEWLKRIMTGFGASWVMWLMIGLSVVSVAIILERAWFFWSLRDDLGVLARELRTSLESSLDAAKKRMEASPSAEAAVVSAGLAVAHQGPAAAEEAMAGASALQRMKLERRLAYLGTLGNNAPFIGLLGTVIGVVGAFDALGHQTKQAAMQGNVDQSVLIAVGEALVATAVGLVVAIPAVMANNYFQRIIKATLANTDALSHVLLGWLKADLSFAASRPDISERKPAKSVKPAKKAREPVPEDDEQDDEGDAG